MADQKRIPEIQLTATASRPLGRLQQHAKWDTSPGRSVVAQAPIRERPAYAQLRERAGEIERLKTEF
jgi:hypothetical protein